MVQKQLNFAMHGLQQETRRTLRNKIWRIFVGYPITFQYFCTLFFARDNYVPTRTK